MRHESFSRPHHSRFGGGSGRRFDNRGPSSYSSHHNDVPPRATTPSTTSNNNDQQPTTPGPNISRAPPLDASHVIPDGQHSLMSRGGARSTGSMSMARPSPYGNRFGSHHNHYHHHMAARTPPSRRIHVDSRCVRIRGLPYEASEDEVRTFFRDLRIVKDGVEFLRNLNGNSRGEAYVLFETVNDAQLATNRFGYFIRNRYVEIFPATEKDMQISRQQAPSRASETRFIKMRGLPFDVTIDQIRGFFTNVLKDGPKDIQIVRLPNLRPCGEVFVEFEDVDQAAAALRCNHSYLRDRYVELFRSTAEERDTCIREMGCGPDPEHSDSGRRRHNVVRLRGLPQQCDEYDVASFLAGLNILQRGIHIVYTSEEVHNGEAYVELKYAADAAAAVLRSNQKLGHHVIDVLLCSREEISEMFGLMSDRGSEERASNDDTDDGETFVHDPYTLPQFSTEEDEEPFVLQPYGFPQGVEAGSEPDTSAVMGPLCEDCFVRVRSGPSMPGTPTTSMPASPHGSPSPSHFAHPRPMSLPYAVPPVVPNMHSVPASPMTHTNHHANHAMQGAYHNGSMTPPMYAENGMGNVSPTGEGYEEEYYGYDGYEYEEGEYSAYNPYGYMQHDGHAQGPYPPQPFQGGYYPMQNYNQGYWVPHPDGEGAEEDELMHDSSAIEFGVEEACEAPLSSPLSPTSSLYGPPNSLDAASQEVRFAAVVPTRNGSISSQPTNLNNEEGMLEANASSGKNAAEPNSQNAAQNPSTPTQPAATHASHSPRGAPVTGGRPGFVGNRGGNSSAHHSQQQSFAKGGNSRQSYAAALSARVNNTPDNAKAAPAQTPASPPSVARA